MDLQQALALLQPDETLHGCLTRARRERMSTGVALVDRALSMRPGVVLEVCGPAGSGKTELLLQV